MQNFNTLKTRANHLGLILRQDRISRNFVVNVRGSRQVYEGVTLKGVAGFLVRYSNNLQKAENDRIKRQDDYMAREYGC